MQVPGAHQVEILDLPIGEASRVMAPSGGVPGVKGTVSRSPSGPSPLRPATTGAGPAASVGTLQAVGPLAEKLADAYGPAL